MENMGHSENNEQPDGKCSIGFGVASWTMVEMMKWIDGNLHVEVRVAVGMENQIVDVGRPYNVQNKDQTDQKVGQRKRGKKKKDRVERTKDHQPRTKTELNCQCVIELRVFLCLPCILSLKIELCMDHQR